MVEKGADVGEASLKRDQQGNGTGAGLIILRRLEGGWVAGSGEVTGIIKYYQRKRRRE